MLLSDQRSAIVQACRQLLASGLVRGTSGNVSTRQAESGLVALTPSGVDYLRLQPDQIAVLAADGRQLEGSLRPSSELALHLEVYRRRPDVQAVVHTHSMLATTFSVLGEELPPVHYLIARAGGRVPVAPYARYGTAELARNCAETLGAGRAVLLANHGVVAAGADLAEAMAVAEAVEFVAELAWRSRLAGTANLLTGDQLAEAAEAFADYGRQPPA